MKMASHTPLPLATAKVFHGVRNAMSATIAAVNIAIGPASGARQRRGTRKTSSATIGSIANIQCRKSTGTCGVVAMPPPLYVLLDFEHNSEGQQSTQTAANPPLELSLYLYICRTCPCREIQDLDHLVERSVSSALRL